MMSQPNVPTYPGPAGATRTSTLAIISLVAGILGVVLLCGTIVTTLFICAPFPILVGIVAIVTGHMARGEVAKSGGQITGNGLALAGLIMGYAQIVLIVLPLCAIVVLALMGPAIGNVFSNIVINL